MRTSFFRVLPSVVLLPLLLAAAGPPVELPPAREIPGITVEDRYPRSCVDCHVVYPDIDRDTRFGPMLERWSQKVEPELLEVAQAAAPAGVVLAGKHPVVADALGDIPASCLSCHGEASTEAPSFGPMIHRIHLTGGARSVFLTLFQGECTHCHKLDPSTGAWSLPGGAEK